ncbi:hypothetical protein [Herbidospora galbida]|uniref:hypothetical protein n=1 Tax=Herbidospora galbida TaxID=2575442 RepID=UPI00148574E5|nr:hypothetical protein [Herbidospora galbida]
MGDERQFGAAVGGDVGVSVFELGVAEVDRLLADGGDVDDPDVRERREVGGEGLPARGPGHLGESPGVASVQQQPVPPVGGEVLASARPSPSEAPVMRISAMVSPAP